MVAKYKSWISFIGLSLGFATSGFAEVRFKEASIPPLDSGVTYVKGSSGESIRYTVYTQRAPDDSSTHLFRLYPLAPTQMKDLSRTGRVEVVVHNPLMFKKISDLEVRKLCSDSWSEWCDLDEINVALWSLGSSQEDSSVHLYDLYYQGKTDLPEPIVKALVKELIEEGVVSLKAPETDPQLSFYRQSRSEKRERELVQACDNISSDGVFAPVKVFCSKMIAMSDSMGEMDQRMAGIGSNVNNLAQSVASMSEDMNHLPQMSCYVEQMMKVMGEMNNTFTGVLSTPVKFLENPMGASFDQILKMPQGFMRAWSQLDQEAHSINPGRRQQALAFAKRATQLLNECSASPSPAEITQPAGNGPVVRPASMYDPQGVR